MNVPLGFCVRQTAFFGGFLRTLEIAHAGLKVAKALVEFPGFEIGVGASRRLRSAQIDAVIGRLGQARCWRGIQPFDAAQPHPTSSAAHPLAHGGVNARHVLATVSTPHQPNSSTILGARHAVPTALRAVPSIGFDRCETVPNPASLPIGLTVTEEWEVCEE